MSENIKEYEKFLSDFQIAFDKYEKLCEERRRRGIHDLNIFDVLETKEVKHSKFLSALLDPDGLHYQDDLFLRELVDICELKDFDFDTSRAKVDREYKNIDIYITDGDKHIIIENKIGTGDHDEQIARYIQAIVDEQNEQDEQNGIYERILVLYLTPFDTEIKSLGGIDEVGKDYLKLGQNQVAFKHISYKNEILKWIEKIKAEIANLIDLSVIITQYEKIVKNLTNQGEEMANAEIKKLIRKYYTTCIDIYTNINSVENEIVSEFLEYLYNALKEKLKGSKTWRLQEYDKDNLVNYKKAKGVIDVIIIEHKKDDNKHKVIQIKKEGRTLVDIYLKCENGDISMIKDFFNNEELAVYLYNKGEEEQEKLANEMSLRIKEELDKSR